MLELFDDMHSESRARHTGARVSASPDAAIASLAECQHGVVARRQLVSIGLGAGAIQHRVVTGRLHRVQWGVYAVGHPRLTVKGGWMAAVLTCGVGATLSHRSAGALWCIAPYAGAWIDVTAPHARRGRRGALAIHGARLDQVDHVAVDGIPVTTVARTLLDLAEIVDRRRLERAFETAERRRLFDLRQVRDVCMRARGRRGLGPMLALLPSLAPPPETRSELERRFLDFCRDHGLPTPTINARIGSFEVDALWRAEKLAVELDSFEFHRTRAAFERDRAKDAALMTAGLRVIRLTSRRLDGEPEAVAGLLHGLIARDG